MPQKKKYRIKNWKVYNKALVDRGSLSLWIDETALKQWYNQEQPQAKGHPEKYSTAALTCILTIREVFHLPYRQTEGFFASLLVLLGIQISMPDYSTLCRRSEHLPVVLPFRAGRDKHIDLVIDATGLKVYGDGEWTRLQHGKQHHRTWRKLHLAVNPKTHMLEGSVLTDLTGSDANQLPPLFAQIEASLDRCIGDGGYDKRKAYEICRERNCTLIAPPQHNASIQQHGNSHAPPLPRDETIRAVRRWGRKRWKQQVGYHVRSLAETAMFRVKTTFGSTLKNRKLTTQQTEARLRCRALNLITHLGMPVTVPR